MTTVDLVTPVADTVGRSLSGSVTRTADEAGALAGSPGTLLAMGLLALAAALLISAVKIMSQLLTLMIKMAEPTVRTGFTLVLVISTAILVIAPLLCRSGQG